MEKTMRKPDWLVSTTFLRHFIFDGVVLLIIKLKFFSGNTDFLKQDNPYWLLNEKKLKNARKISFEATLQIIEHLAQVWKLSIILIV